MIKKRLKGLSLFAGAGIGETFFDEEKIDIVVANELLEKRANLYRITHKKAVVFTGDISTEEIYKNVLTQSKKLKVDFILASPPCQGMSVVGKNRTNEKMNNDKRNFLFYRIIDFVNELNPKFVLIENVPNLLKIKVPFNGKMTRVIDIIKCSISKDYELKEDIYDAADFGVPQHRKRAIVRIFKKEYSWDNPCCEPYKTVRDAIGNLPSLEAGESSDIPWHFARNHTKANIECMAHTPTGCTAFDNAIYYPKNKNGKRVKGYQSSYRRIKWDEPSPTITIRNDCIASQRNVHPGRLKEDGTYSDARVLTPLELMILDSLPKDWIPANAVPELLVRQCIGESIPPLMLKKIVKEIDYE